MAIDNLEEYVEDKFRACHGKTEKMTNCENSVYDKNSMTDNVDFSYVTMAEADVAKCIKTTHIWQSTWFGRLGCRALHPRPWELTATPHKFDSDTLSTPWSRLGHVPIMVF